MSAFILAWVLISYDSNYSGTVYSPAVETLADCQRLQAFRRTILQLGTDKNSQCVQVRVLKGAR
jgi:hypothetical protein